MSTGRQRKIHQSENGDSWWLCREGGTVFVCTKRTFLRVGRSQKWRSHNFCRARKSPRKTSAAGNWDRAVHRLTSLPCESRLHISVGTLSDYIFDRVRNAATDAGFWIIGRIDPQKIRACRTRVQIISGSSRKLRCGFLSSRRRTPFQPSVHTTPCVADLLRGSTRLAEEIGTAKLPEG
jgi:hypothetical protein